MLRSASGLISYRIIFQRNIGLRVIGIYYDAHVGVLIKNSKWVGL